MMNPSSGGWIKKFFSLKEDYDKALDEYPLDLSPEEVIYGTLQPTGLMYGFPVKFLFTSDEDHLKWSSDEKFKVLLLEGLLVVVRAHKGEIPFENVDDLIKNFVSFYEETEIEKAKKNWLQFKGQTDYEKLESILSQRVDIKMSLSNKLWTAYLHNSLVFQDLILYYEYHLSEDLEALAEKRRSVMLDMLKVVAVAAQSDGEIAEEEEAMFEVFMASSQLEPEDREIARSFWNDNKTLTDIEFNYEMSWLMKRYFMEMATLVVWSDRIVVEEEQRFLDDLAIRLGIDEDEKDQSFIAIQSFVINNADEVPFLSGKNDAEQLMSSATDKWRKILGRNKDKLATELKQSKELVQLIAKSTTTELSKEEKKKVKAQFKDLAKSIPALGLFMLPGGTVIMPIVMKLIPDLVPSAFRSNQIEDAKEEE
ncbi:MAG: hypothetical protein H6582_12155 [Crocinitomicaceae bacterium]|nr:hypothetical protein [Crocinitomicaceae bacterium]